MRKGEKSRGGSGKGSIGERKMKVISFYDFKETTQNYFRPDFYSLLHILKGCSFQCM